MLIAACESNHGGDMELARRMILSAKENGADLVKFQLYDAEDDKDKPYFEWVKKAELSFEQAKMLFDYGMKVGIEVFFSVFGVEYVNWCEKIEAKRYKIAYCNRNNLDIIKAIWTTGKPIIVSSDKLTIDTTLYCVPQYPTGIGNIKFPLKEGFDGFSDHAIGIDIAKIALARGAQIIEKHFILDRSSPSPEAPWSMTPDELKELKRWETVCRQVI